jgi:hypothetical protein
VSQKLDQLLRSFLPTPVADGLAEQYRILRRDVVTGTLGRTAPRKFVEHFVQALQHICTGAYDASPNVDHFLRTVDSTHPTLDEGLRICSARLARSIYSLRSKRNIAHIGSIDPNTADLKLLLSGADWILCELLRQNTPTSSADAEHVVASVLTPLSPVLEDIDAQKVVFGGLNARSEILVLLHSVYPAGMTLDELCNHANRRAPDTIRKESRALWNERSVVGTPKDGYRLSSQGFRLAEEVICQCSTTLIALELDCNLQSICGSLEVV